jgi:hypothetical protein
VGLHAFEGGGTLGQLPEVVDRTAFEATVKRLKLTYADLRRYERVLKEAGEGLS